MQRRASSAVGLEQASAMMRDAFAIWENARCGDNGERPSIHISDAFGPAVCDEAEFNQSEGNANIVIFRDREWSYSEVDHELAATWLMVDRAGTIFDADIEINATAPLFVPTGDEELELGVIANQRDLLSIMVHEAGHFLGIDHSREEGAVMQAALDVGQVRTELSPDDEAAICEIYPPDAEAQTCDYTPRNGFASECGPSYLIGSCSAQQETQGAQPLGVFGATLVGLAIVRMRRRR
jgi:hypothetical protein